MQPTEFRNPDLDVTVKVTLPVQKMMGSYKVAQMVVALTEMATTLGAYYAYVGKASSTVVITLYAKDGWQGRMKVPVTRRR